MFPHVPELPLKYIFLQMTYALIKANSLLALKDKSVSSLTGHIKRKRFLSQFFI